MRVSLKSMRSALLLAALRSRLGRCEVPGPKVLSLTPHAALRLTKSTRCVATERESCRLRSLDPHRVRADEHDTGKSVLRPGTTGARGGRRGPDQGAAA